MGVPCQRFIELCRDVLRPLIEADAGKLYLVSVSENELALHLGGVCSGCPGAPLTINSLIKPAVWAIDPNIRVIVTVGAKQPDNAVLLQGDDDEIEEITDTELHVELPEALKESALPNSDWADADDS